MNKKAVVIFICLASVSLFSGCKKIQAFAQNHLQRKPAVAQATPTPTPAPTPVAVEASAPAPVHSVSKNASVVAFCYHNVEDGGKMKSLTITKAEFERQLQEIKDNGFTVISMQDFLAWRRGEKDIPAKSAIITLDDGWYSSYAEAWPILKKFGYPFTLYVYINYIGSGGKSLTWEQLGELRDGGVDIGSHSFSHSNLRSPGGGVDKRTQEMVKKDVAALGVDGWLRKEVVESKRLLEKQLGIKCSTFAYPFGVYSPKVREFVKEAGYEAAFTVYGQKLHPSSPYDLLGRYAIDATKPQIFADGLKMIGGGGGGTYAALPDAAQSASVSMITQPMEGETIADPKPLLKANIATMGDVDPKSIEMRVSGFGVVPAQYDPATKTVSYQVTQKLRDKNYSVIIVAKAGEKRVETRWSFSFDPTGKAAAASASAETQLPPKQ